MSWRETLGVTSLTEIPYTHNSHNTQKPVETSNCADIAVSAYRDSADKDSKLLEVLSQACQGASMSPTEVRAAMSEDDIMDWHQGEISNDALSAFARLLVQRRIMDRGLVPQHYTQRAVCAHCGPVWLWISGEVQGCPWCWNRLTERPIPRPSRVRCGECTHFKRIDHPHLGHCSNGMQEAIAGLWDNDRRNCDRFLPVIHRGNR